MTHPPTDDTHISLIKAGDTVIHNGKIMTVCAKDLTHIPEMGPALFGDTYVLGRQPVSRVRMTRCLPTSI